MNAIIKRFVVRGGDNISGERGVISTLIQCIGERVGLEPCIGRGGGGGVCINLFFSVSGGVGLYHPWYSVSCGGWDFNAPKSRARGRGLYPLHAESRGGAILHLIQCIEVGVGYITVENIYSAPSRPG